MGGICCQTQTDDSFKQFVPHFTNYIEVDWDQTDSFMSDWKQAVEIYSNNQQQQDNQKKRTLMKHKTENRFFVGRWGPDGYPVGDGQYYEAGNLFFDGKFENGIPQGHCQIKFLDNESQYKGNIKEGKADGNGHFTNFKNKYSLEGRWSNSRPISGELLFSSDDNMVSVNFQSISQNKVTINYKDKRIYQGEINWMKIIPEGQGTVVFPQSQKMKKYEGEWSMGKIHGKGKMQWKDGSVYEGDYFQGKKQGFGRFSFASKKCYEGSWKNGKQDGAGILFNAFGQQDRRGLWEQGKFIRLLQPQEFSQQRTKDINHYSELISQEQKQKQQKGSENKAIKQQQTH